MRNTIQHIFVITAVLFSFSAFADGEKLKPEYAWVPEANSQSSFQAELGAGFLDDKGMTGHLGTPVYVLFKANYSVDETSTLFIDLPLAGTISGGPDDFGMGNISIGGNHQFVSESSWAMGFGVNATFNTAQSRSRIGVFTRNFVAFVQDQYAISPYVDLHLIGDKMVASFDLGLNEQIFSTKPAGFDKMESTIFYDGGLSLAINNAKDFWATLEFGGYSNLTYSNNKTVLFGGPGVRYQNDEFSWGLHLQAPFSAPANDQIDAMLITDVRFKF